MSKKKATDDPPPVPTFDAHVFVRLTATDGHTVFADRNCVRSSQIFAALLSSQGADAAGALGITLDPGVVNKTIPHIHVGCLTGPQLERVMRFAAHKYAATFDSAETRNPFDVSQKPGTDFASRDRMEMLAACSLLGI